MHHQMIMGCSATPAPGRRRGEPAPGSGAVRAADRRRRRCRRRPGQRRRSRHRPAAGDLPGGPAAVTVVAHSLVRFIRTGAVSQALRTQLRIHARSGTYADQPQTARLMQYCIARGTDLGPVGENFGAACDQINRADLMLADLRQRARNSRTHPRETSLVTDGPGPSPWPAATPKAKQSPSSSMPPPPHRCLRHRSNRSRGKGSWGISFGMSSALTLPDCKPRTGVQRANRLAIGLRNRYAQQALCVTRDLSSGRWRIRCL